MIETNTTVTHEAADRRAGMTLAELGNYLQRCYALGATGDEPVEVRVNLKGRAKHVSTQFVPTQPSGEASQS